MGRPSMHRFGIIAALMLAAPAAAQDSRVWNFDDNPEAPALEFGAPDSDDALIAFSCDPAAKRMSIVESVGSTKINPGASVPLKLTAGTTSLDLTGDAIASETDGTVSIEVTSAPNPRVFALLRAGPLLTIEVPGAKETFPLAGATPHVAAFEKLCFGKR
jgi:hypothetical protein